MKLITNIFDYEIQYYIDSGLITKRVHPKYPLTIYNYTNKCMYEGVWNEITMQCRGLITNFLGDVIARPFKKFFNLEQENPFPFSFDQPYTLSEKLDGSLGILYQWDGEFAIATRGSFDSEQALFATELLNTRYVDTIRRCFRYNSDWTFLFEIIYPENRIVVDYGDLQDIVYIGRVNTQTGLQHGPDEILGMKTAKRVSLKLEDIAGTDSETEEGFVATFADGNKVKFKYPTYFLRAKLRDNLTEKNIWKLCSEGKLQELLDACPDEFIDAVEEKVKQYLFDFSMMESSAKQFAKGIKEKLPNRKEAASYIQQTQDKSMQSLIFLALDDKDLTERIWKLLQPKQDKVI